MTRRQALTVPTDPVNLIPIASARNAEAERKEQERKARRAAYDKAHPILSFYVPHHLHETASEIRKLLAGLAYEYMTTESSVSMELAKWALEEAAKGHLVLQGRPNARRRRMDVLVVENGNAWPTTQHIPEPEEKAKPEPMYLGWRWTADVKRRTVALANDYLPVGEVVVRLLEYALKAYQEGRLRITTRSVEIQQAAQIERSW